MSGGTKNDSEKPKMRFLTREFLEQTAQAQSYGSNKYGDWNFTKGIETMRLYDAAIRHLIAWADGENIDEESLGSHLGHAAANLNMLMWMLANRPEMDNRYKKEQLESSIIIPGGTLIVEYNSNIFPSNVKLWKGLHNEGDGTSS